MAWWHLLAIALVLSVPVASAGPAGDLHPAAEPVDSVVDGVIAAVDAAYGTVYRACERLGTPGKEAVDEATRRWPDRLHMLAERTADMMVHDLPCITDFDVRPWCASVKVAPPEIAATPT